MVIRLHDGSNAFATLRYNFSKVEAGEADVLTIDNCFYGASDMRDVKASFDEYLRYNDRVEKPIFTASINPAPEDLPGLSDEELVEIAREYMDEMGYGDQPYVIFKHRDIERTHMHVISVKVNGEGQVINSRLDFVKSGRIRRKLEMEHGLVKAEDREIKKSSAINAAQEQEKTKDANSAIRAALRRAADYNITSLSQLDKLLSLMGVELETIEKGERKGLVFYLKNANGERISAGIKGSSLSREFSYQKLTARLTQDEKRKEIKIKFSKQRLKDELERILRVYPIEESDFFSKLREREIEAVVSYTEDGKPFGITYIDLSSKTVIKGSDLGKKYSARSVFEKVLKDGSGRHSTYDERKAMRTLLNDFYARLKRNKAEYPCESILIQKLEDLRFDFCNALIREYPDLFAAENLATVDRFIKIKQKAADKVLEKERAGFIERSNSAIALLPLIDKEKQEELIAALGLKIKANEKGTHVICDGANTNLRRVAPENVCFDYLKQGENPVEATRKLSRRHMLLLQDIIKNGVKSAEPLKYEPYAPWLKYLPEKHRKAAAQAMNAAEIERLASGNIGISSKLETLLDNGFIIKPIKKENGETAYVGGSFKTKLEDLAEVSPELTSLLNAINYADGKLYKKLREKTFNPYYDIITSLNRAYSGLTGEELDKRVEAELKKVQTSDESLYLQLNKIKKEGGSREDLFKAIKPRFEAEEAKKREEFEKRKSYRGKHI